MSCLIQYLGFDEEVGEVQIADEFEKYSNISQMASSIEHPVLSIVNAVCAKDLKKKGESL